MNEIQMSEEENEEPKGSLYTLEREFEASTESTRTGSAMPNQTKSLPNFGSNEQ